jgi:hypothetical protein
VSSTPTVKTLGADDVAAEDPDAVAVVVVDLHEDSDRTDITQTAARASAKNFFILFILHLSADTKLECKAQFRRKYGLLILFLIFSVIRLIFLV